MFAAGTLHIVNLNGHASFAVDRKTCAAKFKVPQTITIDGGTGRFAGATGSFAGSVSGPGIASRKTDGSCDQERPPIVEIDTITGTGKLTF